MRDVRSGDASRWAMVYERLIELDDLRERLLALGVDRGTGCGAAAALLRELDDAIERLELTVAAYEATQATLRAQLTRLVA